MRTKAAWWLACAALAGACGGDREEREDTTPSTDAVADAPETGASDVDAADVDAADVAGDPPSDVSRCIPGAARCAGPETLEVCTDDGFFSSRACGTGERCDQGACQRAVDCTPLTVEACVGCDRYRGCNASGTAEGEFEVPFGQTCQPVEGADRLVPRVCLAGQKRCADEAVQEACNSCGTGWEVVANCREQSETTLCDEGQCVALCEYIEKRDTYVGCEYWALDLDNALVPSGNGEYLDAYGAQYAVVVSNVNATVAADVTVRSRDAVLAEARLEPGELRVFELPAASIQGTMRGFEAYRVTSTVPIIAYQFNPFANEGVFSNDASLLFPTSSLGVEYLVMTRRQTFDNLKGYVTIAAALPGETEVVVKLPPYRLDNPVVTLAGPGLPVMCGAGAPAADVACAGTTDTLTVRLSQYEVLNLETNREGADLTGTRVTSNRPVVVFGGSEAANAPNDDSCVYRERQQDWVCAADRSRPCTNPQGLPDITLCSSFITCCADHLEQQMLPISAWGRRYVAARSQPRGDEADVWRIMAGADGVRVRAVGIPETWPLRDLIPQQREWTLDEGEWIEFQSPTDFYIDATGPVMVGQFLTAETSPFPGPVASTKPPHRDAGIGDPAFILAVPIEQFRADYTFIAPDKYAQDFITVTAPVDAEVTLDGSGLDDTDWVEVGETGYRVRRLPIADGVHTVVGTRPIGVMVHGYDRYVSYGYPAGLDIKEIFRR